MKKTIHSAQIVKLLKMLTLEKGLKMSVLCSFSTRLCAALETVLWSLLVEIKFLKMRHTCADLHILFKLVYILFNLQLQITILQLVSY